MRNVLKKLDRAADLIFAPADKVARFGITETVKHPIGTPIAAISGAFILKELFDFADRCSSRRRDGELSEAYRLRAVELEAQNVQHQQREQELVEHAPADYVQAGQIGSYTLHKHMENSNHD